MDAILDLANHLADEAGKIIRNHFRVPFDVDCKSDNSPVTCADKEAERRMRDILREHRPDDGLLGEEYGKRESKSGFTWVFDPIDGTKQFAGGRPTFVTLVALCKDGEPIMSIMDQPILHERWVGMKGLPTTLNGKEVKIRECSDLKCARTGITSPRNFGDYSTLPAIHDATQFIAWGGHAYGFGQLASGWLDVVLEKHFGPFDTVPIIPIVEGAGGTVTDWQGNTPNLTGKGKVLAVGDPRLLEPMLELLQSCGEVLPAKKKEAA